MSKHQNLIERRQLALSEMMKIAAERLPDACCVELSTAIAQAIEEATYDAEMAADQEDEAEGLKEMLADRADYHRGVV